MQWGGVGLGIAGVGFALVILASPGCGRSPSGYGSDVRYPLRTDPLVIRTPLLPPTGVPAPGRLDESIAAIASNGGTTLDPKTLPPERQTELTAGLVELFGSPASPTVEGYEKTGLDLSPSRLEQGSKVYNSLNCNECHGLPGDGRGPTGPWGYPYPRDFRTGHFKASKGPSPKPTFDALTTLLRRGVPGSSMQPYDLISDDDVRDATAYTIHLSIRGEVEFRLLKELLDEGDPGDDLEKECRSKLARVLDEWRKAQLPHVNPVPAIADGDPNDEAYREQLRRGYRLFENHDGAGCSSCHQNFGRTEHYQWDVWGTPVRPSNLTVAEYRWGKQPSEIAAHIRFGILAANMPAHPYLSDAKLEALTAFVRELPFPARLPPDVRSQVYPPAR